MRNNKVYLITRENRSSNEVARAVCMRSSRLRGAIKVMYVPGEVAAVLPVHLRINS